MPTIRRLLCAVAAAGSLLGAAWALAGREAQVGRLVLEPARIDAAHGAVHLRLRRSDGRPFAFPAGASPWVGVSYTHQVRFVPARDGGALAIELPDLQWLWNPPPRPGDRLLVSVYLGDRPILTAAALPVVASTSAAGKEVP